MATKRGRKSATAKAPESAIISALRFITNILDNGSDRPQDTHCRFMNGQITANTGTLSAGIASEQELDLCPHTFKLLSALAQVKEGYSLTVLDNGAEIAVKSDKFRALVPCIDTRDIPYAIADANQWPLNDKFREAIEVASLFNKEGAQEMLYASVVTGNATVIGTNGRVFIEAWHGCDTPADLILPMRFVVALKKITSPIVGFGLNWERGSNIFNSFTVHFEDKTWLKTMLYVGERLPPFSRVLAWCDNARPEPLPEGFYEAVKAVAPFGGRTVFREGAIASHRDENQGASHVAPVKKSFALNTADLIALEPLIKKFDYQTNPNVAVFFGSSDNVQWRGCMSAFMVD